MGPSSGLRWSPWFRIICERFLDAWWSDLERTIESDAHEDFETIHEVIVCSSRLGLRYDVGGRARSRRRHNRDGRTDPGVISG
eukprot:14978-Pelagococcus_subviridis.AAC.10